MSDYSEKRYWDDIRALADEFIKRDGSREYDLGEAVDETQWIIYNAGNYAVMQYTDNEDAIFDELGDGGECFSGADCFQKVVAWSASFAMQADVRQLADEMKKEAGK